MSHSEDSSVRVYVTRIRDDLDELFLLKSYRGPKNNIATSTFLFSPTQHLKYEFEIVDTPGSADLVIVSQPLFKIDFIEKKILSNLLVDSRIREMPKLIFVGGDFSHIVNHHDFVVLKGTQYRRYLKNNEIIIPPYCEDLGSTCGVDWRQKSLKPTISFCGWAGFTTPTRYMKYLVRNMFVELQKILFFDSTREVFKRGLYFRRKAMRFLEGSDKITTNFIVRRTFSGHAKTIELSPEDARKEYVENMRNSDFVLAPKGDANYSVRFFEALSLGRIPILIDTECCLPLEDVIDYSRCIIRVSYRDIAKLSEIIAEFYNTISNEDFLEMQKEARRVYETYLRYDSFFNFIFPRIIKEYQP